ncbi:MAG: ROK family protein [Clostridiales bacterium]|jgi:glucokinase|nr:ROK family protein [Clostridiales bacterium]
MLCVGFDIGGTKCAVILGEYGPPAAGNSSGSGNGAGDGDGACAIGIAKKTVFPTAGSPQATIQTACGIIDAMLAERGAAPGEISGIGISCGGPLDAEGGRILSPPNLPGWDDIPVAGILRERYATTVRLENDANACAVAEWKFGAARGARNAVFLTFGTGLGAGLILDGRLYRGASGMAGELGHIRLSEFGPVGYGKAGSFEGFCSGGGIARLAGQMALERIQMGEKPGFAPTADKIAGITAKSVADAANGGDPLAREAYAVSGAYLGRGLAIVVDLLNPEIIVIGSVFARSRQLMIDAMERELSRESLAISLGACRIAPAALGESVGDYAALCLALP